MKKIDNVAIIPARKGSVRIKNKSIRKFFGKPIIYYSIKILKKSNIFDKIIVTTNCEKISRISKNIGIDLVIKRPNYISNNKIGTIRVVNHSIKKLKQMGINPKIVCCMYPAAPITEYKNLIFSLKKLTEKKMSFIFPSTLMIKNSRFRNKFSKELIKINKVKKKEGITNKNLLDAGQFYIGRTNTWRKNKTFFQKNNYTFIINENISDINTIKDWNKIKKVFSKKFKKNSF